LQLIFHLLSAFP